MIRRLRVSLAAALLLLAGACMPGGSGGFVAESTALPVVLAPRPAFPAMGSAVPAGHTAYDNASLARLFTSLAHDMEWGDRRPNLVRYEEPVRVTVEGEGAMLFTAFLDTYLDMLSEHSGVAISRSEGGGNLHVRLVPGRQFDSEVPTAFCIVADGNVTWNAFVMRPATYASDALVTARRIDHMTIFIPDTAPPSLVRNCLLEEIPQALGLANDLFGLGSSIFNDDAAHIWPTKLDYLMLRVLYSPGMRTGLNRRETERRARAVLEAVNLAGRAALPLPVLRPRSLGDWPVLIRRIFSRKSSFRDIRESAEKALVIIEASAPNSAQHCYTLVTAGRVLSRSDPGRAIDLFEKAYDVCTTAHGVSDIRNARIELEMACALSRLGRYGDTLAITRAIWPVLAAHGQDERLAALYTIEADALAVTEPNSARTLATERLADEWNAFAMGPGRRAAECRARN